MLKLIYAYLKSCDNIYHPTPVGDSGGYVLSVTRLGVRGGMNNN